MTTTETAITDNAIRTAKIGLGVPSQHTLKSEPDSSDITGTAQYPPALFPNYLPVWEVPQAKYPPIRPFHYIEHGCDADTTFLDLLPPGAKIKDITTALGAEITSVNLEELNDQGKDQLALLAAQKKLLVFRDQKFASMPIGEAVDFCRYFGHLFLHPHSGAPNSHPEIHLVRRRAGNIIAPDFFQHHTHSMAWHSDNADKVQPPGITFLYGLEAPDAGGDTIFVDTGKACKRLSPAFQKNTGWTGGYVYSPQSNQQSAGKWGRTCQVSTSKADLGPDLHQGR